MMRVRNFHCALLVMLVLSACVFAACSDDDPAGPGTPPPPEVALATITSGGSGSGPNQPTQPYAMVIRIGVADKVIDIYQEMPDPLLFEGEQFEDDTNIILRKWDVEGLDVLAKRLMDGKDTTVFFSTHALDGGGSSSGGNESTAFTYNVTRTGPDLDGYTVTGLQVEVDIEVTENPVGWWTQAYDITVSIIGY